MKKLLLIFTLLLSTNAYGYDFKKVQYLSNYDADTVKFNIKNTHPLLGNKMNVRVYGIDTPELRTKNKCEKKLAIESRDFVKKELTKAKKIVLKDCIRGKYFRLVCSIEYDGKDLTTLLLQKNYGYVYYGDTKEKINWCR